MALLPLPEASTSLNCSKRKTGNLKLLSVVLNESHSMQHSNRAPRRQYQPLHSALAGLACLLGPCLWLILPLLVEAASVTKIYGSAVKLPSSIESLCASPQICPDYWDFRPTEGAAIIYGNRAYGSFDSSCLKSTDGARTFSSCPTAYPVTNVFREIDIPGNGSILSIRSEAFTDNRCLLDRSTDGGVSWTQVTIVAAANLRCARYNVNFPGEHMRCVGAICLAVVEQLTSQFDIYRSTDNGDTWALVSIGPVPTNCIFAQNIYFDGTNGVFTCVGTSTGAIDSTRVSVDSGATWAIRIPPANIQNCGQSAILSGHDTGLSQACTTTASTGLRFMSSNAVALTPGSEPTPFAYTAPPNMIGLAGDSISWILSVTSTASFISVTHDGGQGVTRVETTVPIARLAQGRGYEGTMFVSQTTTSPKFIQLFP